MKTTNERPKIQRVPKVKKSFYLDPTIAKALERKCRGKMFESDYINAVLSKVLQRN